MRWGESWLYVYLLLEFQSTVDKYMAVRVMSYLGLLYQDLIRQKHLTANGKLPPVF
ncbi:Rpn family recombination-promoting nuclease/putative transposase [Marinobacter sp. S6332]|nr:Rpn family recombination-promoting nuclease/putative transposase [Marinobacter sp. S6332]